MSFELYFNILKYETFSRHADTSRSTLSQIGVVYIITLALSLLLFKYFQFSHFKGQIIAISIAFISFKMTIKRLGRR